VGDCNKNTKKSTILLKLTRTYERALKLSEFSSVSPKT
jgi:hypothetical protein